MDLLKSVNGENVTLEFYEACIRGDIDKATNLLKRKEEIDVRQLDKIDALETAVKIEDCEALSNITLGILLKYPFCFDLSFD